MRFGPDGRFYVVTDADPHSTLPDVCFETSLRGLELQFRGGLAIDRHPTIFTDRQEAKAEGMARLLARRTSQAIAERATRAIGSAANVEALRGAVRVQILGPDGRVVFDADLR